MMAIAERRLWWLTVYDPTTGIASRIVGAVGIDERDRHLSWMPLDDGAAQWTGAIGDVDDFADMIAIDVDAASAVADGIVLGFVAMDDPPPSPDLAGAVEAAIDLALTASIANGWSV